MEEAEVLTDSNIKNTTARCSTQLSALHAAYNIDIQLKIN